MPYHRQSGNQRCDTSYRCLPTSSRSAHHCRTHSVASPPKRKLTSSLTRASAASTSPAVIASIHARATSGRIYHGFWRYRGCRWRVPTGAVGAAAGAAQPASSVRVSTKVNIADRCLVCMMLLLAVKEPYPPGQVPRLAAGMSRSVFAGMRTGPPDRRSLCVHRSACPAARLARAAQPHPALATGAGDRTGRRVVLDTWL